MRLRLKALLAFVVFLVVEQLVEGGSTWLVFMRLRLLETKWQPSSFIALEGLSFLAVIVATLVVGLIQRRELAAYGFGLAGVGRQILAGSAWGFGAVAMTVGAIAAFGGYRIDGLALHGTTLLGYAVAWLIAMFLLGMAEEATFRATGMFTLGEAIGLWPAAVVTTLIFSLLHYFLKPNETIADAMSVGLLGLFMAFTIIRTGSIWWAVGFHALFDYAALVLFGSPNTGNAGGKPLDTRLLAGNFHGAEWLSGGRTGLEASWLIFPVIAILFIGFDRIYRPPAR
jgi:membrane protease YdiL (CAAX protease family)